MKTKHELTPEDVKDLRSMMKKDVSRWRYVFDTTGSSIKDCELQIEDGQIVSATASTDHTESEIVNGIYRALRKRRKKRKEAAVKAAVTRQRCRELKAKKIARQMAFGGETGPAKNCLVCGRPVSDQESIDRGVGSECWQGVLGFAAAISKRLGAEKLEGLRINLP